MAIGMPASSRLAMPMRFSLAMLRVSVRVKVASCGEFNSAVPRRPSSPWLRAKGTARSRCGRLRRSARCGSRGGLRRQPITRALQLAHPLRRDGLAKERRGVDAVAEDRPLMRAQHLDLGTEPAALARSRAAVLPSSGNMGNIKPQTPGMIRRQKRRSHRAPGPPAAGREAGAERRLLMRPALGEGEARQAGADLQRTDATSSRSVLPRPAPQTKRKRTWPVRCCAAASAKPGS